MATDHKSLKLLVIGLGLLLLGGMVFVVAFLSGKVNPGASTASAPCPDVTLTLPKGASVASIASQGKDLIFLVNEPAGTQRLVTVDRCTPAIKQTLTVAPGEAPAAQ